MFKIDDKTIIYITQGWRCSSATKWSENAIDIFGGGVLLGEDYEDI